MRYLLHLVVVMIIFTTIGCGMDDKVKRFHNYREGFEQGRNHVIRARHEGFTEPQVDAFRFYPGAPGENPSRVAGYQDGAREEQWKPIHGR